MIENLSAFKRLFPQAAGLDPHPVPLGVVAFTGADAPAFLQGQLTCDVREVRPGRARYAGYCTPKGRLLMLGLLAHAPGDDPGFWLVTDAGLIPDLVRRLRLYVLRSKVVVSVPDLALGGFIDLPAGGPLDDVFATTALDDGGLALRYPAAKPAHQRVLVAVPRRGGEAAPADAGAPRAAMVPALADPAWRAADVAAGLAWIEPASREVFVPQALDLGRVPGTLSFTKGCFPGQEIVARVHWLGQVKRGLFRVALRQLPPATATGAGCPVPDAGGQPVGEWVGVGGPEALASLRLDVAGDPERLGFPATPALPAEPAVDAPA